MITLLKRRFEEHPEYALDYQRGFRRDRSTTDHNFALKRIITNCEYQIETNLIFISFKAAYDMVDKNHGHTFTWWKFLCKTHMNSKREAKFTWIWKDKKIYRMLEFQQAAISYKATSFTHITGEWNWRNIFVKEKFVEILSTQFFAQIFKHISSSRGKHDKFVAQSRFTVSTCLS